MHEVAPKVPTADPVHKQLHPGSRLVAVVLVSLIAVTVSETRAHAAGVLPSAWTAADVGSPVVRGSATDAPCAPSTGCPAFSVSGAGVGVGGTADQFMFLYQKLTGDGAVTVRLLALSGASTVEAGLMIRETLTASARHASILMGSAGGAVRSRLDVGGTTGSNPVARGSWLRLARVGASITASVSSDGSQWTSVATQTLALPSTLYVGIVVTSRASASLATATVSNMAVSSTTPTLPSGWTSADVGSAPQPGTASYTNGSFIGASFGAGFTAASDGFRFVYTRVRGDAKLSTRVVASQGPSGPQAGIVLRTTLDADAVEMALIADDAGLLLVSRAGVGQVAAKTRVATTLAPVMLQLDRRGSMVTASYSTDGATWKPVTSSSISLGTEIYAGLAVAAGPNGRSGGGRVRPSVAGVGGRQRAAGRVARDAFDRPALRSRKPDRDDRHCDGSRRPRRGRGLPCQRCRRGKRYGGTVLGDVDRERGGRLLDRRRRIRFRRSGHRVLAGAHHRDARQSVGTGPGPVAVGTGLQLEPQPQSQSQPPSPSPSTDTGSWQLLFNSSADHAMVTYYVLDIYNTQTHALVVSRNIGKPAPAADGTCTVDVNALVTTLRPGLYDAVVRAVASSGEAPSLGYSFSR